MGDKEIRYNIPEIIEDRLDNGDIVYSIFLAGYYDMSIECRDKELAYELRDLMEKAVTEIYID